MLSRGGCVLVAIVLSGCEGCGEEEGPQFTITDPGTGPANSEPLAPLAVGYRFAGSVIDGMFDGPRGPLYRVGAVDEPFGRYYLVTDDGVFDGGGTLRGVLENPVLIVPATVRLGMTWTARYDGEDKDIQHQVTARTEGRDGAPTVWQIASSYPPMPAFATAGYVEGEGPVEAVDLVILDPSNPEPVPRRPMTLEELPVDRDGFATSPSMVRYGTGPAIIMGQDANQPGTCVLFDGTRVLDEDPPTGRGPFTETPGPACVSSNFCRVTESQVEDCKPVLSGEAGGALVHADGRVSWITRGGGTTLAYIGSALDNQPRFSAYAQRIGASGQPEVLYNFDGMDGARDFVYLDGDFYRGRFDPMGRSRTMRVPWQVLPGAPGVFTFHEPGATSFLIVSGGMLYTSRAVGSSPPSNLIPAGMVSGKISVLSSEHGIEILRATAEGSIDELRVDESGLVVTHLADIPIAAGEAPIGAWRWREADGSARLVVQLLRAGLNTPSAHLFRTREKLPAQGTPVAMHPALRITSGALSRGPGEIADPWACWEPGSGPSDPASWSVPGAWQTSDNDIPVVEVDDVAGCVAMGPPGPFTPNMSPGPVLYGTIPNVGRVAITVDPSYDRGLSSSLAASTFVAPLARGGFVTNEHRYAAFGVHMGLVDEVIDASTAAFADQRGNGLWYAQGTELRLLGQATQHFASPQGQPVTIQFTTAGGGVVVTTGGVWYAVTSLGVWTAAPTPLADHTPCARMPDGTLCGAVEDEWYCQPPNGTEVRSGPLPAVLGGVCETRVPFPDGSVIAYLGDTYQTIAAYRLGANGSATMLREEPFLLPSAVTHDAEGQPWLNHQGNAARLGLDGKVAEYYTGRGAPVVATKSMVIVRQGTSLDRVARDQVIAR